MNKPDNGREKKGCRTELMTGADVDEESAFHLDNR